jgi:hypothetical protein
MTIGLNSTSLGELKSISTRLLTVPWQLPIFQFPLSVRRFFAPDARGDACSSSTKPLP